VLAAADATLLERLPVLTIPAKRGRLLGTRAFRVIPFPSPGNAAAVPVIGLPPRAAPLSTRGILNHFCICYALLIFVGLSVTATHLLSIFIKDRYSTYITEH
jgi:hypothetical protein